MSGLLGLIDEIKLKRTKDDYIVWQGNVEGRIEEEDYADAYGWSTYQNANLSLKEAVNKLIEKLKTVQLE